MNRLTQKQLKKKFRKLRKYKLQSYADDLNETLPKSEIWFHKLFKLYKVNGDMLNTPFAGYIPDVINHDLKYVIEIDGSIHRLASVKRKDERKDRRFWGLGYRVYRVEAFNIDSFNSFLEAFLPINRKNWSKPRIVDVSTYIAQKDR